MTEPDLLLKRVERRALLLAVIALPAALLLGDWRIAAGIAGGMLLGATSYWAIKRGASGIADAVLARGARPNTAAILFALVFRYALLAFMAYVMIARLRLHPIGLLGGATVIPLAIASAVIRGRS